jgi:CheY-like chemotaxis protein
MNAETVLVIEDESNILMSIKLCLGRAGYSVITAMNGLSGIEAAMSKKPDLILLDLLLPDMHGLLVCQALKENAITRSIPVVILSAYSEQALVDAALKAGAAHYVKKPFDPTALKETVGKYVR